MLVSHARSHCRCSCVKVGFGSGYLDEARAELGRMLVIDPRLTIAGYRASAHFLAPEVLELLITGLRLASLPEK